MTLMPLIALKYFNHLTGLLISHTSYDLDKVSVLDILCIGQPHTVISLFTGKQKSQEVDEISKFLTISFSKRKMKSLYLTSSSSTTSVLSSGLRVPGPGHRRRAQGQRGALHEPQLPAQL